MQVNQTATSTDAEIQAFIKKRDWMPDEVSPNQKATKSPPSIESTKRTSAKQRKADLEEYKTAFLQTPKIVDRQPVFVSREVRDLLYDIVRRMGERRMSVSGFLENLSRHHLDSYAEELERWKRL